MRVMLFCQTGDARPTCVKSFGWIARDGDAPPRAIQYLGAIRFGTHLQPDRGWLVACQDADAGRMTISAAMLDMTPDASGHLFGGRILASGGRP